MTGSSSAAVTLANPFIGPRPIDTGQKIFGRDREIEELYYVLSAERIVLLHSPSGAGKSSLIQAGLVPRLGLFDVWGPTRVNLQPPDRDLQSLNRYVQSTNLGFEARIPKERQRPPELISTMTLSEYVASRPRRRSAPPNIVLLFDQFEEILTVDPLALEAKHEFFDQLGKLLQDPHIWALFALREDYLAPLDPYAELVPTHLKNRFRLDLLARDAASEAISKSVEEGGRHFAPDAVEKLVNDLATMQVQRPDGTFQSQTGPFVEPLYLQVACRGLWERMPAEKLTIDLDDIQSFGDVTKALAEYYEREVAGIADGDPHVERAIRAWVGEKLITPDGIRGQILKAAGQSDGLDNQLIDKLVDAHLVRAEQRAGAVWYELSHDRLIEPVRTSNKVWFEAHLSKLQKVAAVWEAQGRPEGLLLLDADFVEAKKWASQNESSLTGNERKFLAASEARQEAIRRERRQTRRLRFALVAVTALLFLAAYATWEALKDESRAVEAEQIAKDKAGEAAKAEATAEDDAAEAQKQTSIANDKTREAKRQATLAKEQRIVNAWQSAARQAANDLATHSDDDRSVLLAVQSLALHKRTPNEPRMLIERALQCAIGAVQFVHVLSGFQSPVLSVAFSPDRTRLAAASLGRIQIWDLRTPSAPPMSLEGGGGIAFSPDGYRLASNAGRAVLLWDLRQPNLAPVQFSNPTGTPIWPNMTYSVAFSPDGNRLASNAAGTFLLWDLRQPNRPVQLSRLVASVAFSPDGKSLASSGGVMWDLQQPSTSPQVLPLGSQVRYSVAFAHDGSHFAGDCGVEVCLWDLRQPNAAAIRLDGLGGQVEAVAFSPAGNHLASGHWDGGVRVWDLQNISAPPLVLPGHQGVVHSVAFSPDGNHLASASEDGTVRVWELRHQNSPMKILPDPGFPGPSVAFAPYGHHLASAGHDNVVRVWDPEKPDVPPVKFLGNQSPVWSVAFSPDGNLLASGSDDPTVRVWDRQKPDAPLFLLPGHTRKVGSVAFAPDGHRLACSDDATVRIWDLKNISARSSLLPGDGGVESVAFSPDGMRLAAASAAKAALVWDLREPIKPALRLPSAGTETAFSIAFSPDGNLIALGDNDSTVHVWNLDTREGLLLYGHEHVVWSVAFSPDGSLLASGSDDETVRIWDPRQPHQSPIVISVDHGRVESVAFSPYRNLLALANGDKTVGLWPLWDKAADYLCTVVWRNLSWDEWQSYLGKDIPYERTCPKLPDGEGVPSRQRAKAAASSRQARQ